MQRSRPTGRSAKLPKLDQLQSSDRGPLDASIVPD